MFAGELLRRALPLVCLLLTTSSPTHPPLQRLPLVSPPPFIPYALLFCSLHACRLLWCGLYQTLRSFRERRSVLAWVRLLPRTRSVRSRFRAVRMRMHQRTHGTTASPGRPMIMLGQFARMIPSSPLTYASASSIFALFSHTMRYLSPCRSLDLLTARPHEAITRKSYSCHLVENFSRPAEMFAPDNEKSRAIFFSPSLTRARAAFGAATKCTRTSARRATAWTESRIAI
jgi:hypothetical protein